MFAVSIEAVEDLVEILRSVLMQRYRDGKFQRQWLLFTGEMKPVGWVDHSVSEEPGPAPPPFPKDLPPTAPSDPPATVAQPTIDPAGGAFAGSVEVTLACATPGASIFYTLNGTNPTDASTLYVGPFTLLASATVRARAYLDGAVTSIQASAVFTVDAVEVVATPTIAPNGGRFEESVEVTLACATAGATIRYTTDGSRPTELSDAYAAPFTLLASATVRAIGFLAGAEPSSGATAQFTVDQVAPPDEQDPIDTDETHIAIPASIAEDGSEEVSGAINAWIAAAPSGPGVVLHLGTNKRYRCELPLFITEKTGFRIEGHGSEIFAETNGSPYEPPPGAAREWPRARRHIEVEFGSDIVFRNLKITGPNNPGGEGSYVSALEGQHGIRAIGVTGLVVDGVTVRHVHGDFIYLGTDAPAGPRTTNAVIRGCDFSGSGRQGIALTGVEDVLIENNAIAMVARTAFDIEPNGLDAPGGAIRVTVRNNQIGLKGNNFLSAGGGGPHVDQIVFEDNTLVGTNMNVTAKGGITERFRDPVTDEWTRIRSRRGSIAFRRNTSDLPKGPASRGLMMFDLFSHVEVVDNVQPLPEGKDSVLVEIRDVLTWDVHGNQTPGGDELLVTGP